MAMLQTWKKHQTIPFVDTDPAASGKYVRIGKSTIFDLQFNPNKEVFDFIEDEAPSTFIMNYQPSMGQELRTVKGDPAFEAIYDMMYYLPTGEEATRMMLLVFPMDRNGNGSFDAWRVSSTVALTNFNTVDEKILFDIDFNGTIERGTATVTRTETGVVPVFTPGEEGPVSAASALIQKLGADPAKAAKPAAANPSN
jgi:hypothetical protein